MVRRRRRKSNRWTWTLLFVCAGTGLGWWWFDDRDDTDRQLDSTLALAPQPALTSDRPEILPQSGPRAGVSEKGADSPTPSSVKSTVAPEQRIESLVSAGKQALGRDDLIAARTHFSEAMTLGANGEDAVLLRAELTRIGNETILSPRVLENDPHTARYVIKAGDTLGKIASAYKVSDELLAEINGIRNKHLIRVGQGLKIIKGPFRAVMDKDSFSLDVYLDSTFVRHYQVGLGADGSTPTGQWRVSTKLKNPTYYPPRGGKIIAADDPQNPLGERWIGLEGVAGEALGQLRYGIHGTIEPESIGQNASMGCIRMYNEDVTALYTYLVEKHSTVVID